MIPRFMSFHFTLTKIVTLYSSVTNLFFRPIAVCFDNLIYYFMKTADVWTYCMYTKLLSCLSKDRLYTKMLRIHVLSSFTRKTPRSLKHEDTDKCTLTIA